MFTSNFEKLLQAQPELSKKRKATTEDKNDDSITHTNKKPFKPSKLTNVSHHVDQNKLEQLSVLTKMTALTAKGEKKSLMKKSAKRIDLSAPIKNNPYTSLNVSTKSIDHQKKLTNEEYGLLRIQKDRISKYKDEWFYTKKNQIFVPPLYDPVVIVYHYGLGKKQETIFEEAEKIKWKKEHPNRPYEEKQNDASYEHVLLRIACITKYGEVLYDTLVQPKTKVTNYRTEVTGLTKVDFQVDFNQEVGTKLRVLKLEQVVGDISEIIDNRIIVGYNLTPQAIHRTSLKTLLAKYQTNRQLNKHEIDQLLMDKRMDDKMRSKNHLLDLLMLTHPVYLIRDVLCSIPFPVRHNEETGVIPTLDELVHKYLSSLPVDLSHDNGGNNLNKTKNKNIIDKNVPMMDYQNLKIDKFTLINSKPLDTVTLDSLLNNGFNLLQMYYLYKLKWEKIVIKSAPTEMKRHNMSILKIMRAVEENKEADKMIKQNRREKVLRQRQRRRERELRDSDDDIDDGRWGGNGSDDGSDDGSSVYSDESD